MPLNDIVNVVITRQTQTVSEQGFGVPLIFGPSVRFENLIKYYSDMQGVALDFQPTDREYIAAQDIFSQEISPELIAIGRRQVDDVGVEVVTAMPNKDYTLVIDGQSINVSSEPTATYSVVTLSEDLEAGDKVRLTFIAQGQSIDVGPGVVINWSGDFQTGNMITPRINGVDLGAPIAFTDQVSTMTAIAGRIATSPTVLAASVTGANQITVVFNSPLVNVVNNFLNTGGAGRPTQTNTQQGYDYISSTFQTLTNIGNALLLSPSVASVEIDDGAMPRLTVIGMPDVTVEIEDFVVTGPGTPPVATITDPFQDTTPQIIALKIVDAINDAGSIPTDPPFPVRAEYTEEGKFLIINEFPGTPWTLNTTDNIGQPNRVLVRITQVMPETDYTVTINNVDYTYRSQIGVQSAQEIVEALVEEINSPANNAPVFAEDEGNGSFSIESDNLSNVFSIRTTPDIISYQQGLQLLELEPVNFAGIDLDQINNASNSWYAIISTSREINTVLETAAWAESHIKLFGTASADPAIINLEPGVDVNSIAARLGNSGYVRSFVMYHQDANYDYPEAAWFGRVLPLTPGSETWKFKTLRTISYSNLTTTQSLNALGKQANTYEFVGGVGITSNGTVAEGEYIDVVRGIDWLRARIQEYVFRVLVNNPKVPFTDSGIATIQAEVMRVLQLGVSNDFIAEDPQPTCTVPRASEVPPADKAARILRNVRFQATLSGAIHAVRISGSISV